MIPELPPDVKELYPFEPHWAKVDGFDLHYADEGPRSPDAVVLLHGNPTWSFVYRNIIPRIAGAGVRVVAPDYLGAGRSDHGFTEEQYAIEFHVVRTLETLKQAGVVRAVIFCQDWGGPIGLGMAVARPNLLAGLVLSNTFWGEGSDFHNMVFPWRAMHAPVAGPLLFARQSFFLLGLRLSGPPDIAYGAEWEAYTLPWKVHKSAGATLPWPRAISLFRDHPTQPLADRIWEAMPSMDVPTRFVWGDGDPVLTIADHCERLRQRLPRGTQHDVVAISGGRHFIQEFAEEEIATACVQVAAEAFA